jgi:predicted flap endonuclease-1-like 5' DNA nuclease
MGYSIEEIEGIGPAYRAKLQAARIRTTTDFLKLCCDRTGRKDVAAKTGVSETHLLKWANLADLMRIRGIGPQYSELLEAAGVDTVKELKNRRPDNLAAKMKEVNTAKRLTRLTPARTLVERWVAEARTTAPRISH